MNTRELIESIYLVNRRLASVVGDSVPEWNDSVRDSAERALDGDVYRAPDGKWTRIDFDHVDWNATKTSNPAHIIMVLRRFHVLSHFMSGYRATADERYASGARRYIEAFLRDHPPVDGWSPVPGDGDTQYDIRLGVWLVALGEFRKSRAFDEPLMELMLKAVRENLRFLTGHVRPDRNIRFWHGEVLLLSGLRLAGLPEAQAWLEQGREIVNDAIRRQVLPDGAHMEATPMYHGYIKNAVESLWRLSRAIPELRIEVTAERVAAMHDYHLCSTRPDGAEISLHDSRISPSVIKPQTTIRDARAKFRREAGLPDTLPPTCGFFPNASQVFLRDDWTTEASCLSFDAATRRSFHWQPCRNSITLFAHGRALLVDPGYPFENENFPRYGHRTAHHSTVNFNGSDQSQSPATLRAFEVGAYTLVEGHYGGGYWPLANYHHGAGVFGEHHRTLLWLRGRFGVVLDHVQHSSVEGQKPTIEFVWQLSEGPADYDANALRVVTRHDHGNLLMTFPVTLAGTSIHVHRGERDPMRGWLTTDWGQGCSPAPMVRLVSPLYHPWHGDTATVLFPFADAQPPSIQSSGTGPDPVGDSRRAGAVQVNGPNGARDRFFWTRRLAHAIGQQHELSTDASLVHLQSDASGTVTSGLMIDGTFCRWRGTDIASRLTILDRLRGL